ncbi:F0F1 ATP synthase subunit alpha [Candidatus Uhrbacteria bacterium]|nr:F0F1 ATP synthase subunit alpha [Candidatus Uhrbacteria bacterium]
MNEDHIVEKLRKQIAQYEPTATTEDIGSVLDVGDGIARIGGLPKVMAAEMLEIVSGDASTEIVRAVALNLDEDMIGAVILGDASRVQVGNRVRGTGHVLSVPAGPAFVGRVVDPLGNPVDGGGAIPSAGMMPVERVAPGVITRESVRQPVETGITAIDAMIPIGRGQRELIIGDRQTGKTAITIDAIINQRGKDLTCIYVAIGQKESKVAKLVAQLREAGAMEHTIVVLAGASSPAALWYLAPFAGCAMGEWFMEQGKDVLIVYDDLSKHAWSYRQISLLLKRPPGREAYPGDIFYLHSRLLERAAKLGKAYGGGSLTALPIIETQSGDVSAYIPTNVISITDGQIYLEPDLFYKGVRPAVNVGLSVSRVGSAAQRKAMKKVSGKLRLELAQFRELEAFAQFASELDESTRKQIDRGRRLVEILKQGQYEPRPFVDQVALVFAGTQGYLDAVPVERVWAWISEFRKFLADVHASVAHAITESGELTQEHEGTLRKAIEEFNRGFSAVPQVPAQP